MHPKELSIKVFNYELPYERIAKYPAGIRDESKLLIYTNHKIKEDRYFNLDKYLPASCMLVFNNTKVIEARLLFQKNSGATIEIFCLEPPDEYMDISAGMRQTGKVKWKCLIGNAKKWKDELLVKKILTGTKSIELTAKKICTCEDFFLVEFCWNDNSASFADILHSAGVIPLPPYLHREAENDDVIRYQTIYAEQKGSVAAPTAGLHFTPELFEKLSRKNIENDFVTLHVGAGTFKPVKTETLQQHEMHAEYFEIKRELIENILNNLNNKIIAVGTTSLRTLESLYWMGVKLIHQSAEKIAFEDLFIKQWEAYELPADIPAIKSLQVLLHQMHENSLPKLTAKTQMIIAPPYKLKITDALITNFHQPGSTLLLLVAAIIGEDWKRVYNYALKNDFRFLSYGDGCLLFPAVK